MARFVTFNILAPSYANPQNYPQLSAEELSGHGRNFDHEMKDSQKSSSYTNSCVEDIQNCQLS